MKLFLKTSIRFIMGLMLVGVLLFTPTIPIVLGSLWSLLCFLPYIAVIVVRIKNEKTFSKNGLVGYTKYKKRAKYRLIPFIW